MPLAKLGLVSVKAVRLCVVGLVSIPRQTANTVALVDKLVVWERVAKRVFVVVPQGNSFVEASA